MTDPSVSVAWCEIHNHEAATCECPEGAYEERHADCATVGQTCIAHTGPPSVPVESGDTTELLAKIASIVDRIGDYPYQAAKEILAVRDTEKEQLQAKYDDLLSQRDMWWNSVAAERRTEQRDAARAESADEWAQHQETKAHLAQANNTIALKSIEPRGHGRAGRRAMSDRDDLAGLLIGQTGLSDEAWSTVSDVTAIELADQILAAGWRPTASLPEQASEGRLRTCPAHPGHAPFLAVYACPWCEISKLQAARSTVTREQVEIAATAIADYVGGIAWGRDVVSVVARQLGLSVAEDGEQ